MARASPPAMPAEPAQSQTTPVFHDLPSNFSVDAEIAGGDARATENSLESRPALSRRVVLGGGLAAAFAAAYAIVRPPLALWPAWRELTADYRTETGEQRQLALPGDVAIRMNTQTSIGLLPSEEGAHRSPEITGPFEARKQ